MPKEIIAVDVDVDDVLVTHFQDLMNWYNGEFDTQLTLADNHPTSFENWNASSFNEAVQRVQRFFETPAFLNALPHDEAIITLTSLSKRYDLMVLTSRDVIIEKVTRHWIDLHFPQLFKATHFTSAYSLEGKARSKADVCLEIGAKYLIDDLLDTVTKVAKLGVQAVLFGNFPWNQSDTLPEGVTRCLDWPAVQEYFDGRD